MRQCLQEHVQEEGLHWHFDDWDHVEAAVKGGPVGTVLDSDADPIVQVNDIGERNARRVVYVERNAWIEGDLSSRQGYTQHDVRRLMTYDPVWAGQAPPQHEVDEAVASILSTYEGD